jgi:hypothetical protein
MTGCDAPTPPESEDDANMLQPSEQPEDPVANDNEMQEMGRIMMSSLIWMSLAGKRQMLV